jgi:predicted transcriptional regulator
MIGKVDLAAAILELAMNEISRQHVQERLGLSTKDADEQLKLLKSKDLIDISKTGKSLNITKRGTQFLDLYKSIHAKYLTVSA